MLLTFVLWLLQKERILHQLFPSLFLPNVLHYGLRPLLSTARIDLYETVSRILVKKEQGPHRINILIEKSGLPTF